MLNFGAIQDLSLASSGTDDEGQSAGAFGSQVSASATQTRGTQSQGGGTAPLGSVIGVLCLGVMATVVVVRIRRIASTKSAVKDSVGVAGLWERNAVRYPQTSDASAPVVPVAEML
jgi:hypothetical protein